MSRFGSRRLSLNHQSLRLSGDPQMIANIEKTIAKEKDHVRRNYKAKIMGSNERIASAIVDPLQCRVLLESMPLSLSE